MAPAGCGSLQGTFGPVEEVEKAISVDSANDGFIVDANSEGGDAPAGALEPDIGSGDG
jgi:hypothetical protein